MIAKKQIGQFEIQDELGRGGMAVVYRAVDTHTNQQVALKVLYEHWLGDSGAVKRFVREAKLISQLDHPNIVPIVSYGDVDGQLYLALAYMEGGNLAERFAKPRPLTLRASLNLLKQVALSLDYAHSQGVIHRDLKLQNILLDSTDKVYLSDFGIARLVDSTRLTTTGMVAGTPLYMSPEQARGELVDPATDIYAMAVMAYLMTTGFYPFTAEEPMAIIHKHMYEKPPTPTKVNPKLPTTVDEILLRGLDKHKNKRYPTATEFVTTLQKAVHVPKTASSPITTMIQTQELNPIATTPAQVIEPQPKIASPIESQTLMQSAKRNQSFAILGFLVALFAVLLAIGTMVAASQPNEPLPTSAAAFLSTIDPTEVRLQFIAELTSTADYLASLPTQTYTPTNTSTATTTPSQTPTQVPSATITDTPQSTETPETTPIEYFFPDSDAQVDVIEGAYVYTGAKEEYGTEGILPYRSLLSLYGRDALGNWVEAESQQGFKGWMRVQDIVAYIDVLTLPITWNEDEFLNQENTHTPQPTIVIIGATATTSSGPTNTPAPNPTATPQPSATPTDTPEFQAFFNQQTRLFKSPGAGCPTFEKIIQPGWKFEANARLRNSKWLYGYVFEMGEFGWVRPNTLDLTFDPRLLPIDDTPQGCNEVDDVPTTGQ